MGRARLQGDAAICRYFARCAPASVRLYGAPDDPLGASQIDDWVGRAVALPTPEPALGAALGALDSHLRMRAFVAGHALSLADAAVWLAIRQRPTALKASLIPIFPIGHTSVCLYHPILFLFFTTRLPPASSSATSCAGA